MQHLLADDEPTAIDHYAEILIGRDWDHERISPVQLSFPIKGAWAHYSISVYESAASQAIQLICGYPLKVKRKFRERFLATLTLVNEQLWDGHFTWCPDTKLVLWRYRFRSSGDAEVDSAITDAHLAHGVQIVERYAPCLLNAAVGCKPKEALKLSIGQPLGRA